MAWSAGSSGCVRSQKISNKELRDFEDIIESQELAGWSKEQVHARFGKPSLDKSFYIWGEGYFLRPDDACVDSDWFVLRYDEGGNVVETGFYHD